MKLHVRFLYLLIFFVSYSGYLPAYAQDYVEDSPRAESSEYGQIPFKKESDGPSVSVARVIGSFLILVLCVVGSSVWLKKILKDKKVSGFRSGSRITVLDAKRVSTKVMIFVVSVDDAEYIIVQSGENLSVKKHTPGDEKQNDA